MAPHETIPRQDPAGAKFESATYKGPVEPFFDAGVEVVDVDFSYTLAADIDLPELAVVHANATTGAISLATITAGVSDANAILAMPLKGTSGDTGKVPIHTSGHWNTQALIYGAAFNTNTLKENAFVDSNRPMIRASTPKFSADAIDIPN